MTTPDTSHIKRRSLAELVESIESSANPVRAVLEQTLERLRQGNPELAECVRYGAIPREVDAALLGVLRGQPEDRVGNERLLGGLIALSFIAPAAPDRYRYQETTRQCILDEWRSDATRS